MLEVMVVLAIVGIGLTLSILFISDDRESYALRRESERLQAALRMALENAAVQGREWGLSVTKTNYRFFRYEPTSQTWVEEKAAPLASYNLPADLTLTLENGVPLAYLASAASAQPDILLLSSGQTSPFVLDLQAAHSPHGLRLSSDGRSDLLAHAIP